MISLNILKKNKLLIAIIFLATFFRFYILSSVPPSPSLDEASLGYNAYSILKTGSDEYGTKFPILLRAYDDFRPALYVYLVIPFVKFLGLTVMAVRLPSVILSVLTVFVTFFLAQELMYSFREKIQHALLTSFLLAISPWHIYISRLGHEVNPGLTFVLLGVLFFLKAVRVNISFLFLSTVFFALSLYTYQSEKVIVPLLVLVLTILFREKLLSSKKKVLLAIILGIVISSPIVIATLSPQGLIRLQGTNVFSANQIRFDKQALRYAKAVEQNDALGKLVYNRRIVATKLLLEGYFSHFNPEWLFTNPSSDKHKVPGLGLLYLWEVPFLILGIIRLLKEGVDQKMKTFIFSWIFLTPLAGAFTTDTPHAMRIFTMLPIPQVLTSLGLLYIARIMDKSRRMLSLLLFVTVIIMSLLYLYKQYFFVFPMTQSSSFQYALSQAIPYVLENQNKYDKVIFSNQGNLYQSYMFFLFYSSYYPILYQKEGGTVSGGFAEIHKFGKFEFRSIDWEKDEADANHTLYVGNPDDFPSRVVPFKTTFNLDGKEAIKIIERKT